MIHGRSVRMNTREIAWGFLLLNPKVLFRGQADSPFSFFCLLHTQDFCLVSFLFLSCYHSMFLLDFASLILEWDTVLCSLLHWKRSTQVHATFNIFLHIIFFSNKDLGCHSFHSFHSAQYQLLSVIYCHIILCNNHPKLSDENNTFI